MPGMGTTTLPIDDKTVTADELEKFMKEELNIGTYVRLAIRRDSRTDLTRAFLAAANSAAQRRRKVAIVCASDVSAQVYHSALAVDTAKGDAAEFSALQESHITTAFDLAFSLFADERVCKATGRDQRVLDANEMDVLMEDVKVSGIKPGRLREMLKFFYKSMADCFAEEDGWLETGEEKKVFSILEENLEARRAMLPAEVFGLAWRGMMDGKVGRKPLLVLCDDWSALSKSAQRLMELLATEGLIIAGGEGEAPAAGEPYPNPEGFESFTHRPNMSNTTVVSQTAAQEPIWAAYKTPSDEAAAVAKQIAGLVAKGTMPRDILVAVPSRAWAGAVAAQIKSAGIAAVADTGVAKVKGDPRYPERCGAIKQAAFEKLQANPTDMTALRTYIGAGDWLLCSEAFLGVLAYAREHEMPARQALVELHNTPAEDRESAVFSKLDKALDELDAAGINYAAGLDGEDVAPVVGAAKAAAPDASAFEPAVVVTTFDRVHGRHAEVTFVLGMVNGFLPAKDVVDDMFTIEHRRNALVREQTLFNNICASASSAVFASRFESDTLKNATLAKAQVQRVYAANGERMARVEPSIFCPDGTELPAVISCGPCERVEGALSTAC